MSKFDRSDIPYLPVSRDFYDFTREWYYSNLNESVIFDNSNDLALDEIFSFATEDEV